MIEREKSTVDYLNEYFMQKMKRFQKTFVQATATEATATEATATTKEDKTVNENIEPCLYDKSWYKEKKLLIENNPHEMVWKKRIMLESTPLGNVIMHYDVYRNGFAYYSNNSMKDSFLNALAMKYVLLFKCRDFFMDTKLSPVPSPLIQVLKEKEKEEDEEKDSNKTKPNKNIHSNFQNVFIKAKLPETKKVVVVAKPAVKSSWFQTTIQNIYFFFFPKKIPSIQPMEKKEEVQHTINRFIRLGKIDDFSFLPKKERKSVYANTPTQFDGIFDGEHKTQRETINYSQFKKERESIHEKNTKEEETKPQKETMNFSQYKKLNGQTLKTFDFGDDATTVVNETE
jgi:hypothetical protein